MRDDSLSDGGLLLLLLLLLLLKLLLLLFLLKHVLAQNDNKLSRHQKHVAKASDRAWEVLDIRHHAQSGNNHRLEQRCRRRH